MVVTGEFCCRRRGGAAKATTRSVRWRSNGTFGSHQVILVIVVVYLFRDGTMVAAEIRRRGPLAVPRLYLSGGLDTPGTRSCTIATPSLLKYQSSE
jgi:hypothetical protein